MAVDVDVLTRWTANALLSGSVHGAVLVALIWCACRHVPRVPASVQAWLWWAVALKLVLALAPVPAVQIAILPAPAARLGAVDQDLGKLAAPAPAAEPGLSSHGTSERRGPGRSWNAWLAALVASWFAVLAVQGVRLSLTFRRLRGVIARSTRLTGAGDLELIARLSASAGLRRVPDVRASDEVDAPQVVGVRRPVVLLPTEGGTSLGASQRAMAICHELMHIRRGDLALGWVPALAERLFFFHPLARLAAREYVTAREAACDAAVVRALRVPPETYARLLVHLGIARSEPALAAGGSSLSMSSLKRRLDMLRHASSDGSSRLVMWSVGAALAMLLVPFELVASRAPSDQDARPAAAGDTPSRPAPLSVRTSPDGRWEVYAANEFGEAKLYVIRPIQGNPEIDRQLQELAATLQALQPLIRQQQEMVQRQQKLAETLRELSAETARIRNEIQRALAEIRARGAK